jgi:archaellum component FlaC
MRWYTSLAAILFCSGLSVLPLVAQAQSYRCTGTDGKRYYGQTIPRPCIGQVVEQLNPQGMVIRRIEPRSSADEREAKAAEEKKQREEELARREELRRNRALLATYTSVDDIESARARALEGNARTIKEVNERIAEIKARLDELSKEIEALGSKPVPIELKREAENAQFNLQAQEGLRSAKLKEAQAINSKYDEDRRRYAELTQPRTRTKE